MAVITKTGLNLTSGFVVCYVEKAEEWEEKSACILPVIQRSGGLG